MLMPLAQVKEIVAKAAAEEPGSNMDGILPPALAAYLRAVHDISDHLALLDVAVKDHERVIADLNAGLIEYATQSGQGQLMLDNLRLCIDQVRMRRKG